MNNSKLIHIDPLGFREYDARWIYPKDINAEGIANVGRGLGTQIKENADGNWKITRTSRFEVSQPWKL